MIKQDKTDNNKIWIRAPPEPRACIRSLVAQLVKQINVLTVVSNLTSLYTWRFPVFSSPLHYFPLTELVDNAVGQHLLGEARDLALEAGEAGKSFAEPRHFPRRHFSRRRLAARILSQAVLRGRSIVQSGSGESHIFVRKDGVEDVGKKKNDVEALLWRARETTDTWQIHADSSTADWKSESRGKYLVWGIRVSWQWGRRKVPRMFKDRGIITFRLDCCCTIFFELCFQR